MRLYIIRHGETDWNKARKMQGRSDIPLNEHGRLAAQKTKEGLKDVKFDVAFTSPLKRAKETVQILLEGRDVPIIEDERIIEIGFGNGEGLACVKDKTKPDVNFNYFFVKPGLYTPHEGGETFEDVKVREEAFLQELFAKKEYQDSTILISTHGAALCGLLRIIKKNPVEKFWDGGLHQNCGMSIVDVKDGKAEILQEAILLYDAESL